MKKIKKKKKQLYIYVIWNLIIGTFYIFIFFNKKLIFFLKLK